MQTTYVQHVTIQKETNMYTVKHVTVYADNPRVLLIFFQRKNTSNKVLNKPNYKSKEKILNTPIIKKKQRLVREPKEWIHSRMDSPTESLVLLFRTMHPYTLGFLGLPTY